MLSETDCGAAVEQWMGMVARGVTGFVDARVLGPVRRGCPPSPVVIRRVFARVGVGDPVRDGRRRNGDSSEQSENGC